VGVEPTRCLHRRIAKGLRENVNFMWLEGGNRPDFRMINRFRGEVMKGEVRKVFTGVLELLIEEGYVKLENYFVDGTKVETDANLHKVVWAKKTENTRAACGRRSRCCWMRSSG
jgi:transposase